MPQLSILHSITKKETAQTLDLIIQNIIEYAKLFPNGKYFLIDSSNNQNILSAAQTLQIHFPQFCFSKVSKDADHNSIARDFYLKKILLITNDSKLTAAQINYAQRQIFQNLKKDSFQILDHKEIALRAEKSIWKKFLLYFKYES